MSRVVLVYAVVCWLVGSTGLGQVGWDFDASADFPPGWIPDGDGGSWSISPTSGGTGGGNAMVAAPDGSPLFEEFPGADPQLIIDAWSPEFRFQDIYASLIDFDFSDQSCDPQTTADCDTGFQGLQVALFRVENATTIDELEQLLPTDELWQRLFSFSEPGLPIDVVGDNEEPPADHVDGQTQYRIRMRVFDRDVDPDSLMGVEVDNLQISSAALFVPGDYNGDGHVNAADYTLWRDTLGQPVTPSAGADGSGNGVIDQDDYDIWKQSFGPTFGSANSSVGSASGVTIPEPSSLALAALVSACVCALPLFGSCDRTTRNRTFFGKCVLFR